METVLIERTPTQLREVAQITDSPEPGPEGDSLRAGAAELRLAALRLESWRSFTGRAYQTRFVRPDR